MQQLFLELLVGVRDILRAVAAEPYRECHAGT
jgi:hypothetical protein